MFEPSVRFSQRTRLVLREFLTPILRERDCVRNSRITRMLGYY